MGPAHNAGLQLPASAGWAEWLAPPLPQSRRQPRELCWLPQKRINLTKTVRKLPINDQLERAGHYLYDDRQLEVKYDDPSVCLSPASVTPPAHPLLSSRACVAPAVRLPLRQTCRPQT